MQQHKAPANETPTQWRHFNRALIVETNIWSTIENVKKKSKNGNKLTEDDQAMLLSSICVKPDTTR